MKMEEFQDHMVGMALQFHAQHLIAFMCLNSDTTNFLLALHIHINHFYLLCHWYPRILRKAWNWDSLFYHPCCRPHPPGNILLSDNIKLVIVLGEDKILHFQDFICTPHSDSCMIHRRKRNMSVWPHIMTHIKEVAARLLTSLLAKDTPCCKSSSVKNEVWKVTEHNWRPTTWP